MRTALKNPASSPLFLALLAAAFASPASGQITLQPMAQNFAISGAFININPISTATFELSSINTLIEYPFQGLSLTPIDPNRMVTASMTATTTSGQNVSICLTYASNLFVAAKVNQANYDNMIPLVRAFFNDRNTSPRVYDKLTIEAVKKQTILNQPWAIGADSHVKLHVRAPVRGNSSGTGPNGGLVQITVHGSGDFFSEAIVDRMENCTADASRARETAFYVLRNARSLSVKMNNMPVPTQFQPASAALAAQFSQVAVDGVPFLDISGATKLYSPSPELPSSDACLESIYVLDNFPFIQING